MKKKKKRKRTPEQTRKLRHNQAKLRQHKQEKIKQENFTTLFDFARFLYEKTGKRGFIFLCQGYPPFYSTILEDKVTECLVKAYDPNTQFVLSYPLDSEKWKENSAENPCTVAICQGFSTQATIRFSLSQPLESLSDEQIERLIISR